jgi:hypothetical protein
MDGYGDSSAANRSLNGFKRRNVSPITFIIADDFMMQFFV